jgi:hypothetical protein
MLHSSHFLLAGRTLVQTHQIYISNGRERVQEIRDELFAFPEVLDVFITSRPDALVVVCSGRPHPGEWLRALRAVGYHPRPRRRAASTVNGGVRPDGVKRTVIVYKSAETAVGTPDAKMSKGKRRLFAAAS